VTVQLEPPAAPEAFRLALVSLHAAAAGCARPGLELHEVPAPRKLAPYSAAIAAEVLRGDEEVASGRFVVLHDPAGQDGWKGDTRIVAFVSAEVEPEMAADPALGAVGWSWLTDSLAQAPHTAAGGTVTRTSSTKFGSLAAPEEACEVEVRASWTAVAGPDGSMDLGLHLRAWCDLLAATAGLPPPGVTALR
jgi:hypothetical protein